jgi:hypothetical protein
MPRPFADLMDPDPLDPAANRWEFLIKVGSGVTLAVAGYGVVVWFVFADAQDRSAFGDMFGGISAIFSALAFAGLIYTILLQRHDLALQRQEIAETRTEIAGQREQLERQSGIFDLQQFESTFFQLLSLHHEIVRSLYISSASPAEGRAVLQRVHERLLATHSDRRGQMAERDPLEVVRTVWVDTAGLSGHFPDLLTHYFRNLFQVAQFVDDSRISQKQLYMRFLRAQLSGRELFLLFFYALGPEPVRVYYRDLIQRYGLLESLPPGNLGFDELRLYLSDAYGDNSELRRMAGGDLP